VLDVECLDLVLQAPHLQLLAKDLALLPDPEESNRSLGRHPVLLGLHRGVDPFTLELKRLPFGGEVLSLHATPASQLCQLELLLAPQLLPVLRQLLLLQAAFGCHLRQPRLLGRPEVRVISLELDLVADLGLQLAAELRVHDEDLGQLSDLDGHPPLVPRAALAPDGRLEGRLDHRAQRRLALLDALDHGHVGDRVAQLAEADVDEQVRDLRHPGSAAEVEEPCRRDGIGDAVDDDPLEAQGDAVPGLLRELEGGFLLRAGHEHEDGTRPQEDLHGRATVVDLPSAADQQVLVRARFHDRHAQNLLLETEHLRDGAETASPVPRLAGACRSRGAGPPTGGGRDRGRRGAATTN
jgi:hypothetical protein